MDVEARSGAGLAPGKTGQPGQPSSENWFSYSLTRLLEITVASIVLVLSAPVLLLVAVYIRRDSPGPALFRQKRVGKDLQLFTFYKFRTLYVDARERFPELYAYNYSPEELKDLQFKNESDPRVTRAGQWLRRTTLDEIPNFINLLKGDIALVGPRPEIPEMVRHHAPEHMIKFSVRPGITGLAQICGRGRLKFHQTNSYDAHYVKNRSFLFDCRILLNTVKKVVRLDGAF